MTLASSSSASAVKTKPPLALSNCEEANSCPNCNCNGQCRRLAAAAAEQGPSQTGANIDLQHAVEKMVKLNQENFDLRLHCYHLKEKLDRLGQSQSRSAELDSSQQAYWEEETGRLRRELRDQDGKLRELAAERDSLQSDNSHLRDLLQK
uniref:Cnn_1N domain-containing protein n=1 Tax=Macrostomum lignano TaxID=282301 RepID=A0A1I8GXR9_9PLAT